MKIFAEDLIVIKARIANNEHLNIIASDYKVTTVAIRAALENGRRSIKGYLGGNDVQMNARRKVKYAILNKTIKKPTFCEKCKITKNKLQGHHPDYNNPLNVIWLCPSCHASEHPKVKELSSTFFCPFITKVRVLIGLKPY